MRRTAMTGALLLPLALGGCAAGEDGGQREELETTEGTVPGGETPVVTEFGEWDADADTRLAYDEFDGWLRDQQWFESWDGDGDDILSREEFARGAFSRWDGDGDGRLDETEWSRGAASWFRGNGAFGAWDTDGDGSLTAEELRAGMEEQGPFAGWDRDGDGLAAREFGEGWFELFDEDDDAALDASEWSAANTDWRAP